MDNNNNFSNNLNQNLISEQNQYQSPEEIENDNLIQLSDDNEPPPPNFIPLEVSLPPAQLAVEKIEYEGQQNINEPGPQASPPNRGGNGKQKMIKLSSYKKKKNPDYIDGNCFIDCISCLFELLCAACCG